MIELPVVTDDFDGQIAALDQAIREAAETFVFSYTADAPKWENIEVIPDLVYRLISHYTLRGFLCTYDGDEGKLTITWDHPNMSWLEQSQITRAVPTMIPYLGIGFRASLLYLCMTNGSDLRSYSDVTLQRQLGEDIPQAASLGNTELAFGFPSVPAPVVTNLFRPTFDLLQDQGFLITYDVNTGFFIVKWGANLAFTGASGTEASVSFE